MTELILVYITCGSRDEAETIGRHLLSKRLAACINIVPGMHSAYFWPPGTDTLEEADELILLVKTVSNRFGALEAEVLKLHSYENPSILAIPVVAASAAYRNWIVSETSERTGV
jgi:periplasmic divalent cation tolerance protein